MDNPIPTNSTIWMDGQVPGKTYITKINIERYGKDE